MDQYTVVVTDSPFPSKQPYYDVFKDFPCEIIFSDVKNQDQFLKDCEKANGMIVCYADINKTVIEHSPKCKIFARTGIAVNNVDVNEATKQNIYVTNVRTAQVPDVANHAVALILNCAKKIVLLNNSVKSGVWDIKVAEPVYCLTGKKLGLIGFGGIAKEVSRRIKAFDMEVLAYDPYVPENVFEEFGVQKVPFEKIISDSDFISIHMPLNDETKNRFSYTEFKAMKPTAYIINTARGGIIDEAALIDALEKEEIAGAGLDVISTEFPGPDHPLFKFSNVVLTPHSAYFSVECNEALQRNAANEVLRVLKGEVPISLVNTELIR